MSAAIKYAIVWVVLVVIFVLGLGSLNWWTYRRLAVAGVRADGHVLELLPLTHGMARYEYHFAGQTFEGQMQPWPPNPELGRLKVGDTVEIYCDPKFPNVSVLGDPKPILHNETVSIGLGAVMFPTLFVGTYWFRKRHLIRRGKNQ